MTMTKTLDRVADDAEWGRAFPEWIQAAPEAVGFSPEGLVRIDAAFQNRIDAGLATGFVYAVARKGKLVAASALGHVSATDRSPLALDSVFRLMSMTKPVTAVALMMLFEEGLLDLADPVSKYLPEFAEGSVLKAVDGPADETEPLARPITVQDILRHTSGYGLGLGRPFGVSPTHEGLLADQGVYWFDESLADQMARIASVPLATQPGAVWNYSLSPDIQARLVEVLSGQDFATFLRARIFEPLSMKDTGFTASPDMRARLAGLSWMGPEGLTAWAPTTLPPEFPGTPWPEPIARLDEAQAYERGAFGLYSTAGDYLRFAQTLLDGGRHVGGQLLKAETIALMARDHLGDIPIEWKVKGVGFGLGFAVIKDAAATGFAGADGTYYWDGAAGTIFWVDPENELVVVALAQHLLVPGMDPQAVNAAMHDLIYAALRP
ncbi:MAG: hypothetical protein B7Y99_00910 [Caulobacterales bacterium 32-69-10]|nr:MAG: hypothetical protein B7Y99_00910 [Caulobacterales bacterium 32-69-10]